MIRRYVPLKADFGDPHLFEFQLLLSAVPGQADRALPGDLMRSMQRCYWSCIQQVRRSFPWAPSAQRAQSGFAQAPLVFRPVMTQGAWGNIMGFIKCCPQCRGFPRSRWSSMCLLVRALPQHHARSLHSRSPAVGPGRRHLHIQFPAAPSPSIRPVPVFGHPPQSVSPSPGQMPPQAPQNLPVFCLSSEPEPLWRAAAGVCFPRP